MSKRNSSVLWTIGNQGLDGSERSNARKNIGVNFSNPPDPSGNDNSLVFLSDVNNENGTAADITFTKKKVTVDGDTYDPSNPSSNPASAKTIKKAIETLDVEDVDLTPNQTLKKLSEADGKISAEVQTIKATWVDNTNQWLEMLYVTSNTSVSELSAGKFASGLSNVYVGGYPTKGHNYLSVNCGEGLFVDDTTSSASFGKLCLSKAASDSLGGIRVGYTSSGDNIAVQLNNSGQGYVTVPISDIESEIAALRVFSSISVNEGGTGAFVISPTNNNSTLKLKTDGNITLTQPTSTTDTIQLNYTLPAATSSVLGGIKTGFASTLTDEKYAVQLGNDNKAYVTVDDMFKLTEGAYSTTPKGVHMNLTCSSPTNGAAVSITNRSGASVNWPSKSASTDPIGYLLPTFATGTTGKRLVLDNGSVKWADDATVYTAGTDIKITNNKISVNTTGTTSATNAFVIGAATTASGNYSFAGGLRSKATGPNTFSFGADNIVSGHDSIALGSSNNVPGAYSTAIGHKIEIPDYGETAGGTFAIGQNLTCPYPGVIYMGNFNTGDAKEYGTVRVTGQGYTQAGQIQSRDIELLYADGMLELYSGYRTTSYILSDGTGKYSTLQSSYHVFAQGIKDDTFKSVFGNSSFYTPLLYIGDRYTYRAAPSNARFYSSTLSRDGLVVNAYDDIGGTSVDNAYIARFTPEQIEFESTLYGVNLLVPETPSIPAWSGSTTSADMSAARIAFKSSTNKWANLKTGTISIRFFRASELTRQHPLVPSEEEGELTFIYNDIEDMASSEFYIWDRYTELVPGTPGPERKSGYISVNNFCIMLTVEASQDIGKDSFRPGVFSLLTADSEAQAASDPIVVTCYGYGHNNPTSYEEVQTMATFGNHKVVRAYIKDSTLLVPSGMGLVAYFAGVSSNTGGRNSFYFQCCGHMYRCDYDATTTSHTNWVKAF